VSYSQRSQHSSGVMQVAHHFFENGVAFFTRNLQIGISFTAASGDGEWLWLVLCQAES
jgi:hypothetical protein